MSRPPCRFYQSPSGCNRGNACGYAHTDTNATTSNNTPESPNRGGSGRPSSSPQNRPRRNTAQSPSSPPSSPSGPGICQWFWKNGNCKREFECRFRHVSPDTEQRPTSPSPLRFNLTSEAAREIVAPFLTEKGLAKVNGFATDGFFAEEGGTSLSPTEAQQSFRRFLMENYKFRHTFDVYAFFVPLSSANSSNKSWTQEEGQLLLSSLTSPNGSLRILDVINWPQVVVCGADRTVLSFQRGFLPLLRYMSSEFVIKSTLTTQANHLFNIVLQNLSKFASVIETCMEAFIKSRSFRDPRAAPTDYKPIDTQVFSSIAAVLHEFLIRFKNAVATYPQLSPLIVNLRKWFQDWRIGITATPPVYDDLFKNVPPGVRDHIIGSIEEKIERLSSILEREEQKLVRSDQKKERKAASNSTLPNEALVAALHTAYEGPGHLRIGGPRHDNDFEDMYEIRIAPTHEELLSRHPPFLPANFFDAPHPAPPDSMQRLLDIQFRLLREELTAPLRQAVQLIHDDLKSQQRKKTKLVDILQNQGGKYRGQVDSQNSLMFNVYTGVKFLSLVPDWKGISTSLFIDTPPGRGRTPQAGKRASFWESMSGKRLSQGGLIALMWESGGDISFHLGIIASSSRDLTDSVKKHEHYIQLRILFFDTKLELRVLRDLRNSQHMTPGVKLLVESPVMYEAIRPFLEALRTEPEDIPFSRYLVHQPVDRLKGCVLEPPRYARLPHFEYQLASLFPKEADVDDLTLSVADSGSIERARMELRRSRLDPSQVDAVLDALTREVALIQGPPGTGKSFTGVEILRVLQANNVGPILMIAFTNHALDHMLLSVLDANITQKIVRLGRRSNDERISKYSIETLEMARNQSRLERALSGSRRELKEVQEQIASLMDRVQKLEIDSTEIIKYLSTSYPEAHEFLSMYPPPWVSSIKTFISGSNDNGGAGEWQRAGRGGQVQAEDNSDYAFWKDGADLAFITYVITKPQSPALEELNPQRQSQNMFTALADDASHLDSDYSDDPSDSDESEDEVGPVEESWKRVRYEHLPQEAFQQDSPPAPEPSLSIQPPEEQASATTLVPADIQDAAGLFASLGFEETPVVPSSDRTLAELLEDAGDVWDMSTAERQRLHGFWATQARLNVGEACMEEFDRLRKLHADKLNECNEIKEEGRRSLLQNIDIIGCTTTGAAQLTTLLKNLSPKVLLVEEAGQVMEAHILGSLVPSIEHLILIGDPLQLRPTLNNYSLSMDSKRGSALYRFDMSLMERLSTSGLAMSRIDVQRRMRPKISSLIRNTLYPTLEDHPLVKDYPDVRGIRENVYFLNHTHKENEGGDDTASKYNMYEVAMICDLVLYLLRQGCYSDEGDIVVLCAYLGQLARLRDALAGEVAVVIDENDQAALADQEGDKEISGEVTIERVGVTKRVRLRTVDNYQGEEGRIVILSLVRNAGDPETEMVGKTTIGFLRSENRTNVALSRAREGLFIFGNAQNLATRSNMWRSIVEELEENGNIGPALPIICHRHQDTVEYISEPGRLPQIAPDGGCLRPCETRLSCGHNCPFKCHCDDPNHVTVTCLQPCRRLCSRDHPCRKSCSTDCGKCRFPIANVLLPCGHTIDSVECWQLDLLETVFCDYEMEKQLPQCEHTALMACGQDPSLHRCDARCDLHMDCCSKACNARCHECQAQNSQPTEGKVLRTQHRSHPCEKYLHCGHPCQERCSVGHQHTAKCRAKCRQVCKHARCHLPCSTPCAPCQEPCTWTCPHHTCPVPCGSVCVRLPCDKACTNKLKCGHPCPSVCGEDCSVQVCPECAPINKKTQVVDLILSLTLEDVSPQSGELDNMLITIPSCRHVFTVETLDGHTAMNDFYSRDAQDTKWTGLRSPMGFVKAPTCPSCRAPISSPRYGRIIKRADLDILERNVAAHMSESLNYWQGRAQAVDEGASNNSLVLSAATIVVPPPKNLPKTKKLRAARDRILESPKETPASEREIQPGNDLHYVHSEVIKVWRNATHPLFNAYREIVKIADTRSAHTQAWEAAFSFLYDREIQAGLDDPAIIPRRPLEHAMRMAKMQVGQPRPLADRRFLVEAFWATLQIRLTIIRLAQTWWEAGSKRQGKYHPFQLQQWATYIDFLFQTCILDVEKALKIAQDSKAHRQITKSVLLSMRIDLELSRFNVDACKQSGAIKDNRGELVESAARRASEATDKMWHTIQSHFAGKEVSSRQEEVVWVKKNFTSVAEVIIEEWEKLGTSLRMDTFYEPVSLEEKMQIIKVFGFASTGHYYTCPNGHIFVIGECGGAMERSRCPECGSAIGGENHHLDNSNFRSTEFDDLAQRLNTSVRPSPWAQPY